MSGEHRDRKTREAFWQKLKGIVFLGLVVSVSFILGYMAGSSGPKPQRRTLIASGPASGTHERAPGGSGPGTALKEPLREALSPEKDLTRKEEGLKEALQGSTSPKKTIKNNTNKAEPERPSSARKTTMLQAQARAYHYSIQVGAFKKRQVAEQLKNRLQRKGYTVRVLSPPEGGGLYKVRVGYYKDRRTARTMALKLARTEKLSPLVVKER